jgi:hypothetical protein
MTDICDAKNIATCRMYRSAREVWFGLTKNAREGMAATGQIAFWTVVLLGGQVLPIALLLNELDLLLRLGWWDPTVMTVICLACGTVYLAPSLMRDRIRQSSLGTILHPFAILVLLAIQWYAVFLAVVGKSVGWKGRAHPRCGNSLSS